MFDWKKSTIARRKEMSEIRKERVLDTFAAHREHKIEYGSKADTVMRFAQNTQYNIDAVRKERKFRQMV